MFGLEALSKIKAEMGGITPDRIIQLLKMKGIDATFGEVSPADRPEVFRRVSRLSASAGSDVLAIQGKDARGRRVEALLVFCEKDVDSPAKPL